MQLCPISTDIGKLVGFHDTNHQLLFLLRLPNLQQGIIDTTLYKVNLSVFYIHHIAPLYKIRSLKPLNSILQSKCLDLSL